LRPSSCPPGVHIKPALKVSEYSLPTSGAGPPRVNVCSSSPFSEIAGIKIYFEKPTSI
ncbi:MAG: hypothetical protein ACI95C_001619, partial [Pseudohongiellaceae bacterium]